ncbi:MAG: hypothetical protein Q9195_003615 [Heterodermia aff. obscurata]
MANRGYDVVVDVDAEGDLGHTDLQEDLEFHSSISIPIRRSPRQRLTSLSPTDFTDPTNPLSKPNSLPPPATSSSPSSKRYLWSLPFYAQFFDVDTTSVLSRCASALYPRAPFLDTLEGNPDLYGPIWIATTVVFILFLTGTISQYLAYRGKEHFAYDFSLLSGAAGLVYGYTLFIPVVLWGLLRWYGASSSAAGANGEGISLVECWALYGYGNIIWIPVALISWSPITVLNWVFVGVGLVVSVGFLVRNLWPVVSVVERRTSRGIVVAVVLAHVGLALAIKMLFFA